MTFGAGARSTAQCAALFLVSFLLAPLVWRVTHASGGVAGELATGATPPAPTFSLERLNGPGSVDLESYAGTVVVLNFWASWCGPCQQEAAGFERAWQRWRKQPVTFVGVDARDAKGSARQFLEAHHVSYPNGHAASEDTLTLYGVGALPATFIISPAGRVVDHLEGFVSEGQLNARVASALRSA